MATAPATPPMAPASAAEPVNEVMVERSSASNLALPTVMPLSAAATPPAVGTSPSMKACTLVLTRFMLLDPAPAPPRPTIPAASATEAATTSAWIVGLASAVRPSSPLASMPELRTQARTSAGSALPFISQPIRFCASDTPTATAPPTAPTPSAPARPATVARMLEVSVALMTISPPWSMTLASTAALVPTTELSI